MLQSAKKLRGFHVRATDGDIGEVTDVYFDDERWVLRYFIVDTGGWLTGRKVLISPYSVSGVDWTASAVVVNLTREQVRNSPDIDTDVPVSRQQEAAYLGYYGYPLYWPYTSLWAWGATPVVVPPSAEVRDEIRESQQQQAEESERNTDVHLRSCREVLGYHIQARDEAVGHVEDFLFAPDSWAIRHIAIDTRNWLPGKHVMITPEHIQEVRWPERMVVVDLSRRDVETSPEYDPANLPASGPVSRRSSSRSPDPRM